MAKIKLNYKFNNPNTVEKTIEILINFLVEINSNEVKKLIDSSITNKKENNSRPN